MLLALPSFFLPRQVLFALAKSWARSMIWMLRVFCNIRVEFRGLEKFRRVRCWSPQSISRRGRPSRCCRCFGEPLFILKRELTWIPLFGLYLLKAQMIPVNRGAGARRVTKMTELARERVREDRQLIIFPGRHAPSGRRRAALQIWRGAGLCRLRRAVSAGGAEFRTVLAATDLPALSRNDRRRVSRSYSARLAARRISGAGQRRRSRPRPRGSSRKAGGSRRG